MFEEAQGFDQWRDLYDNTIFSNLAYAYALKGNMTMAKHFFQQYQNKFGECGVDYKESDILESVQQMIDAKNERANRLAQENAAA